MSRPIFYHFPKIKLSKSDVPAERKKGGERGRGEGRKKREVFVTKFLPF
jgi:hypothetical protein